MIRRFLYIYRLAKSQSPLILFLLAGSVYSLAKFSMVFFMSWISVWRSRIGYLDEGCLLFDGLADVGLELVIALLLEFVVLVAKCFYFELALLEPLLLVLRLPLALPGYQILLQIGHLIIIY